MSSEMELYQELARLREENGQLQQGLCAMREAARVAKDPRADHLDCVGYLTIKHYSDGGLQTSGNIQDLEYALGMLDHAADAIRAQHAQMNAPILGRDGNPIVNTPNRDVDLKPDAYVTRAIGDMSPEDRGTDLLQ